MPRSGRCPPRLASGIWGTGPASEMAPSGGGAGPPACSLPSVALVAADSKSVTWTQGSCVAQAVSFPSLTALRSAGAAASGRSAQVTCPAASFRAPGDARPGPARLAGPAALRLPGMTTVTGSGARSRLLPPRHCSRLPSSRPGQGLPLTLGPAPGSFPLPQAACLKPIPRSHSWSCGFDVRLKGCVFFPRGAFHELLTREGNKAICKFLS